MKYASKKRRWKMARPTTRPMKRKYWMCSGLMPDYANVRRENKISLCKSPFVPSIRTHVRVDLQRVVVVRRVLEQTVEAVNREYTRQPRLQRTKPRHLTG